MNDSELIRLLHRCGHFWAPTNPDGPNVTRDDLDTLTMNDRVVREAIRSWQGFDANFEHLALTPAMLGGHGRSIIPDGDVGPVTRAMTAVPRCPLPDWPPPPGAYSMPIYSEDADVQRGIVGAIESMRENATGSGSWPVPGCDPQRPNQATEHSVRVNIDTSRASGHQRSILDAALRLVEQCEAEFGQAVRHILDGDPLEAEHDIRFQPIPGGVIGFNYFPQPGTCRQTVTGRIDSTYNRDALALATLFVHEYKGHGDGLRHTRGGIMNPSLLRITPLSWRGDPHERTKIRYFGGEPIDTSGPTPPPGPAQTMAGQLLAEPNAAGGISIRGDVRPDETNVGGLYIAVPDGAGNYVFELKPEI